MKQLIVYGCAPVTDPILLMDTDTGKTQEFVGLHCKVGERKKDMEDLLLMFPPEFLAFLLPKIQERLGSGPSTAPSTAPGG